MTAVPQLGRPQRPILNISAASTTCITPLHPLVSSLILFLFLVSFPHPFRHHMWWPPCRPTDHNPYVVKPMPELSTPQVYGNKAPQKESFEDLCGPPTACPACPDPKYSISSLTCYSASTSFASVRVSLVLSTKLTIILCVFKGFQV